MSLIIPSFRHGLMLPSNYQGGTYTPPDPDPEEPPPTSGSGVGELGRPLYAGATLRAQDNFMSSGGFSLSNFNGPSGNFPWSMNTTHPPSGAYFGPQSSQVSVIPPSGSNDGYLRGYFAKTSSDITVTCNQNPSHQHIVHRNGHYIGWPGANGAAKTRGGVFIYEMQYPPKFVGMGHVALLWPVTRPANTAPYFSSTPYEHWPQDGEDDFPENFTGSGSWTSTEVNIHYGFGTSSNTVLHKGGIPNDMTGRHKYAIAWHPGVDDAGTGCYLAHFIDNRMVYGVKYNDTVVDNGGTTRSGARMIMHGIYSYLMSLRLQVEAYNRTDADYNGGTQYFRFYYFQNFAPLTLAQMQAAGYLN